MRLNCDRMHDTDMKKRGWLDAVERCVEGSTQILF